MGDRPALWQPSDLAEYLGLTENTVIQNASQAPHRLPPRVAAMRVLRWDEAVVRRWVTEQSRPVKGRAGRPRAG